MKNWMLIAMVFAVMAPSVVSAHEGHIHKALGTVSSIDGPHMVLKTTAGKAMTVMLDKTTKITRGSDQVDSSALKVGGRVSVDYMEEKGMMMAHAIKLSATPAQVKK
jgi:hypothetical protein